jgi:hypothetical protein
MDTLNEDLQISGYISSIRSVELAKLILYFEQETHILCSIPFSVSLTVFKIYKQKRFLYFVTSSLKNYLTYQILYLSPCSFTMPVLCYL